MTVFIIQAFWFPNDFLSGVRICHGWLSIANMMQGLQCDLLDPLTSSGSTLNGHRTNRCETKKRQLIRGSPFDGSCTTSRSMCKWTRAIEVQKTGDRWCTLWALAFFEVPFFKTSLALQFSHLNTFLSYSQSQLICPVIVGRRGKW
jgi:hypothetical protein